MKYKIKYIKYKMNDKINFKTLRIQKHRKLQAATFFRANLENLRCAELAVGNTASGTLVGEEAK